MRRLTIKERVVMRLEGIEESAKIKDIFQHKGRTCIIIKISMGAIGNWHNGYVQTMRNVNKRTYNEYAIDINAEEITFSGSLYSKYRNSELKNKKFIGFDTGHCWNISSPKSKTFEEVKKRTIKLCEEMVKKGL